MRENPPRSPSRKTRPRPRSRAGDEPSARVIDRHYGQRKADPEILQRCDRELDTAFEQARHDQDLTVPVQTVRRRWFEADAWRGSDAQRQFLARMDRYIADGHRSPASGSPAR